MRKIVILCALAIGLAGCANFTAKLQAFSAQYQTTVATINADIAATAPLVTTGCVDIQKYAYLIVPFIPTSGKASQYLNAANAAITAYCQAVPTDIPSTVAAVSSAAKAAQSGYNSVAAGG